MKKKNQMVRLKSIVQNDRLSVDDEFYRLLNIDLENVLREYFDFNQKLMLSISKNDDGYKAIFSLNISRIKPFTKLP